MPNPGESLRKIKLQNDLPAEREKRKALEDEIERLKFELHHVTQLLFILLAFFLGSPALRRNKHTLVRTTKRNVMDMASK